METVWIVLAGVFGAVFTGCVISVYRKHSPAAYSENYPTGTGKDLEVELDVTGTPRLIPHHTEQPPPPCHVP